mgnify:CR=1 FL=1
MGKKKCECREMVYSEKTEDGSEWMRWKCVKCGRCFVPADVYDVAVRVGLHLCGQVAREASSAVKDTELRAVAEDKLVDYIRTAFFEKLGIKA